MDKGENMYAKEQIINARIEIEVKLQALNMLLFDRYGDYGTTDRKEVNWALASEELERLKDYLAFLK